MPSIDDPTWAAYRDWGLASDHALSTMAKSVRYLKFLEREHGLQLVAPSRPGVTLLLARGREARVKPRTLNSWIREINLWLRFREAGWNAPYFRDRAPALVRVPERPLVRKLLALRWANPTTNARNRAILGVLLDVGPRRDELVHLDLEDLVETAPMRFTLKIREGKGEKSRELWIDRSTAVLIQTYVENYRIRSSSTALFTTPTGRVSYGYLGRIVQEMGARVGAPWLSCHKLRHYCVDTLFDEGVSVPSVAKLMGHARWETTALYRSKRREALKAEEEIRGASKARFGAHA